MSREQMMDAMIRRFGFEDERVIEFCMLCTYEDDYIIDEYYEKFMK